MTDVDTDQQESGMQTYVTVATSYGELNQFHVIMEVAPRYARSPEALNDVYVPAKGYAANGGTGAASSVASGGAASNASAATSAAGADTGTSGSAATSMAAASIVSNPALRDPSGGQVLSTAPATMVPLSAFARFADSSTPTSISHQDAELSTP